MADEVLAREKSMWRLVRWPSPQDYNEAVQNPRMCFVHPDLAGAEVELNALGLPKPATGNFASVYRFTSSKGALAVRCFLHPIKDHQERYRALGEALSGLSRPYLVPFEFVAQGIKVGNDWIPIVKMDWARGENLIEYIRNHLNEPLVLQELAESFRSLVLDMQSCGIAHGDLQHGNIIVGDSGIRLVDYDGMFVESLRGKDSNELGHANYQHPDRTSEHFDATLDNFSAWLIYLSLLMLAEDPNLWNRLTGGDECLLFRKRDFDKPLVSVAFHTLEEHPSSVVQNCARMIRGLVQNDLASVPSLDTPISVAEDLQPLSPLPPSQAHQHAQITAPRQRSVPQANRKSLFVRLVPHLLLTAALGTAVIMLAMSVARPYDRETWSIAARNKEVREAFESGMSEYNTASGDLDSNRNNHLITANDRLGEALSLDAQIPGASKNGALTDLERAKAYHARGYCQLLLGTGDRGGAAFETAMEAYAKLSQPEMVRILKYDLATALSAQHNYDRAASYDLQVAMDPPDHPKYPEIVEQCYEDSFKWLDDDEQGGLQALQNLSKVLHARWSAPTARASAEPFLTAMINKARDLSSQGKKAEVERLLPVINSVIDLDPERFSYAKNELEKLKQS